MGRRLDSEDLEAALIAGLFLSAGGSGQKASPRHRLFGAEALSRSSSLQLVPEDEVGEDEDVLVVTGVGAPGYASSVTVPDDSIDAARALLRASGANVSAVIPGHVPGTYAWLVAAALGMKLLDSAANGRGHPTVTLGGMGLASQPTVQLYQACSSRHGGMQVVARGNLLATSRLMRATAVECGGLVMAVRGPLKATFVRSHGARQAISFQLALGHAMLAAAPSARVDAVVRHLRAEVLCEGDVVSNDVVYRDGFDVGTVTVRDSRRTITLGVYNEFMTADSAGERLATFPDLIGSLDPATGAPLAISELQPGARVSLIAAHRSTLPLGAGVFDEAAYADIERALGTALVPHVFDKVA